MIEAREPMLRSAQTRRILTIDGGGIKGAFPAAFLAELERRIGQPIVDYFDLIAGTSTGGIIALALGLGLSAQEIVELYDGNARRIFHRRLGSTISNIFRAKYAIAGLRGVLREVFQDRALGESRTRLIIPSLNLATEYVHIYKTSHDIGLFDDYKVSAVDVALATVAAPTYFPVHLSPEGVPFIDGSVWARNPLGLAIIEALGVLKWPASSIRVLSLGCTDTDLKVRWKSWRKRTSLGTAFWAVRLANVFMKAQSSSAIVTAHALIGANNLFRIDPQLRNSHFSLDGIENLPLLRQLGKAEARRLYPSLEPVFFQETALPFVPCHQLSPPIPLAIVGTTGARHRACPRLNNGPPSRRACATGK